MLSIVDESSDTFAKFTEPCDSIVARLNATVESTGIVRNATPEDLRKHPEKPTDLAFLYLLKSETLQAPGPPPWLPADQRRRRGCPLTALSCVLTSILKLIQNEADVYGN